MIRNNKLLDIAHALVKLVSDQSIYKLANMA